MFVLFQKDNRWCSAFQCDACGGVIEDVKDGKALIYDKSGRYEPHSHFHQRCVPEEPTGHVMPLAEFTRAVMDSFPM